MLAWNNNGLKNDDDDDDDYLHVMLIKFVLSFEILMAVHKSTKSFFSLFYVLQKTNLEDFIPIYYH